MNDCKWRTTCGQLANDLPHEYICLPLQGLGEKNPPEKLAVVFMNIGKEILILAFIFSFSLDVRDWRSVEAHLILVAFFFPSFFFEKKKQK